MRERRGEREREGLVVLKGERGLDSKETHLVASEQQLAEKWR